MTAVKSGDKEQKKKKRRASRWFYITLEKN
jgi:hypothetical protein